MARRRGKVWRCQSCGKTAFSSHRIASKALARLQEPGNVYFCRRGGGYHVTREDPAEYDRRRASHLGDSEGAA